MASGAHDRSRYQGTNLLRLSAALALPPVLLYLRVVFAIAAERPGIAAAPQAWLLRLSTILLVLFFAVQLACAWYLQRFFYPTPVRPLQRALTYVAFLLVLAFLSVTGAVAFEAFGYALFVRVLHE